MRRRDFLGALCAGLLGDSLLAALARGDKSSDKSTDTFGTVATQELTNYQSVQSNITVDFFRTAGEDKKPLVIILHGSGGLVKSAKSLRNLGQRLCDQGINTAIIHYFDQTGNLQSNPKLNHEMFGTWFMTIENGIDALSAHAGVDPSRIGIFGVSLGASLALSVAASDKRIKCVVEMFGALPKKYAEAAKSMPPTLVLHGEKDQTVRVENAHELNRMLDKLTTKHESVIYPNQGHGFEGRAQVDAVARTLKFFKQNL